MFSDLMKTPLIAPEQMSICQIFFELSVYLHQAMQCIL